MRVAYSVVVSQQVKNLLKELRRSDRTRSRQLALLLLRLEKEPRPEGSRRLGATSSQSKSRSALEERVWEQAGFRIAYRVTDAKRAVEVGIVAKIRE